MSGEIKIFPMDHAQATELFSSYWDRELEPGETARLEEHLHSCVVCRREYQASIGNTLDFTVLFLAGEHFLSAALVTDPAIFDYAADKKIYLASPTVLLPMLRAVATGWKAERTEENAKRMHDAGVELFNRFVIAMEKISSIGLALKQTVDRYNEAIRSIDARLWPKGEEMQRMAIEQGLDRTRRKGAEGVSGSKKLRLKHKCLEIARAATALLHREQNLLRPCQSAPAWGAPTA